MSCRNYFISMLCLSILSCSTENSTDTLSAIQVRTHMDETSSIATEKDLDEPIGIYLKESADAESLIDGVADYAVTSQAIYLLPIKEQRIVQFDRQGNFVKTLIREGQGPQEFAGMLSGIQVDEPHDRLYLFGSKIWEYSLSGKLIQSIQLPLPVMYSRFIESDRIAAVSMAFIPFQAGSFGIGTLTREGELLCQKNNFSTPALSAEKTGLTAHVASGMSYDGHSVLFKSGANDTVFRIGRDTISVACVLRLENSVEESIRSLDVSDFSDIAGLKRNPHDIFVQDILETQSHFYFRCRYNQGYNIIAVHKTDGTVQVERCKMPLTMSEMGDLGTYQYGLLGMFGTNTFPVWGRVFGHELVQVVSPSELDFYQKHNPIELPKSIQTSTIGENPIIIIYKFKN